MINLILNAMNVLPVLPITNYIANITYDSYNYALV